MNPRKKRSNSIRRGDEMNLKVFLVVLFLVSLSVCINQGSDDSGSEADIIQPELSEEGFIELVNSILVEKVSLEMFDLYDGRYTYIRNTFDCNGTKIRIAMDKTATEVYISVSPGHFRGERSVHPQMIDTKGLFTHEIESQADLTPPSSFKKTRTYDIEVKGYNGKLNVSRGHVSIFFNNIGGLSPTPTPPGPRSLISQIIYYGFTGIFILAIILAVYGILVWRRRRKS